MPVLSPPDPGHRDPNGLWLTPTTPPSRSSRIGDFFDEPRNRALVVAAVVLLGLVGFLAVTVTDSGDGSSDLTTPSPGAPADPEQGEEAITGFSANATDPPSIAEDAASTTVAPSSLPATVQVRPSTSAVPSTAAPSPSLAPTAAPPTAPPTTPAPTTAPTLASTTPTAPTTAPTTAAPTTPAPTTAPTTAAPTTPVPTTALPAGGGSVQQQILGLVNTERAAAGCGALALNGQLNNAASAHSQDMAANNYFDHTGLNGSKPWDRAQAAGYGSSFIGENIAQGYGSADAVMTGWMNSSGHRANILNCQYDHLGVGLSSQGNYWTQLFGGGG